MAELRPLSVNEAIERLAELDGLTISSLIRYLIRTEQCNIYVRVMF
jgi:hypothetical protein